MSFDSSSYEIQETEHADTLYMQSFETDYVIKYLFFLCICICLFVHRVLCKFRNICAPGTILNVSAIQNMETPPNA